MTEEGKGEVGKNLVVNYWEKGLLPKILQIQITVFKIIRKFVAVLRQETTNTYYSSLHMLQVVKLTPDITEPWQEGEDTLGDMIGQ